jgi:hypothetical protein
VLGGSVFFSFVVILNISERSLIILLVMYICIKGNVHNVGYQPNAKGLAHGVRDGVASFHIDCTAVFVWLGHAHLLIVALWLPLKSDRH